MDESGRQDKRTLPLDGKLAPAATQPLEDCVNAPTEPLPEGERGNYATAPFLLDDDGGLPGRRDLFDLVEIPREHYTIQGEIARGGMGRVLRARDRRIGRPVAVKEVQRELLADMRPHQREELLERFEREARLTARLQHPGIVPVYEIGRFGDHPFISMKLVDGKPLATILDEARTLEERLPLLPKVRAVAEAVAYAHDQGVIHRDLKPANILLGPFGEAMVIDWGLAKVVRDRQGNDTAALESSVLGTPEYMSPEQARREELGATADVYALGALLYQVLTGHPPYRASPDSGDPTDDVISQIEAGPPTPIEELESRAPAELRSIVYKAMARERGERYATATGLVRDLAAYEAGRMVEVHSYSAWDVMRRWVRRHRAAVATATVFLVALAATATWAGRAVLDSERRTATAAEQERAGRERSALSLELRGREALRNQHQSAALELLGAAYWLGSSTPDLRRLIGMLTPELDAERIVLQHPGRVEDVQCSSDGTRFIVASEESVRVNFWEPGGTPRTVILPFEGSANAVVLSPSGKFAAAVTEQGNGTIWNVDTGAVISQLKEVGSAEYLEFSGDETAVISSLSISPDFRMRVIDVATGLVVREQMLPQQVVSARRGHVVAIDPVTDVLYRNQLLREIDVTTGKVLRAVRVPFQLPSLLAVASDPLRVAVGTPNEFHIVELETGKELFQRPTNGMSRVAFSAADPNLVLNFDARDLTGWHVGTPRSYYHPMPLGASEPLFFAGGKRFVISTGAELRVYDADSGALERTLLHSFPISRLASGWNANSLVVSDTHGTITAWQVPARSPLPVEKTAYPGSLRTARFVANGRRILAMTPQQARILDPSDGRVVAEMSPPPEGHAFLDRSHSRVTNGISVYNTETGAQISKLDEAGEVFLGGISDDGTMVASSMLTGPVVAWAADSGKVVWRGAVNRMATALVFSPDNSLLAAGDALGTVRVFRIPSGELVRERNGVGMVRFLAFDESGEHLAVAADRLLLVVSVGPDTRERRVGFKAQAFANSPSGRTLLMQQQVGPNSRVHSFDTSTLELRETYSVQQTRRTSLSMVDDTTAIFGGEDGTVLVWNLDEREASLPIYGFGAPIANAELDPERNQLLVVSGETLKLRSLAPEKRTPAELAELLDKRLPSWRRHLAR